MCSDLGVRAGFRGGTLLDLKGSLQLLSASHLRGKRQRVASGHSFRGECGMDFSSVMPGEKSFRAVFAARPMAMGIFFGSVLILPLFIFVKIPNFTDF